MGVLVTRGIDSCIHPFPAETSASRNVHHGSYDAAGVTGVSLSLKP